MLLGEFSEGYYINMDERQIELYHRFLKLRDKIGWLHRYKLMRNIVRTKKYTKSVYPPGWKFI